MIVTWHFERYQSGVGGGKKFQKFILLEFHLEYQKAKTSCLFTQNNNFKLKFIIKNSKLHLIQFQTFEKYVLDSF